jgi:hypothetical protein
MYSVFIEFVNYSTKNSNSECEGKKTTIRRYLVSFTMRLCRGRNDEMTDMVISNKKYENWFNKQFNHGQP